MYKLTLIHTVEPATGKTLCIPACELYRTLKQAQTQVMRREYQAGIATWLTTYTVGARDHDIWYHAPVGESF